MLKQRIVTAIVLAAAVLVVVFLLPQPATVLALAILTLAGAWEWAAFAGIDNAVGRTGYVTTVAAVMGLVWWLTTAVFGLEPLLWLSLAWWIIALFWVTFFPGRVNSGLAAVSGVAVLVPAWVALVRLYLLTPNGPEMLVFVLFVVWAADVGAYFAGGALGRTKLAPRVSPGKTWEGVLGGLLAALGVGLLGAFWFDLPVTAFLLLCVGVVLASVVGDLTESMFKRHVGLKDSGSALPGHGGVLDRIDSITAAAPVFLLGLGMMTRFFE